MFYNIKKIILFLKMGCLLIFSSKNIIAKYKNTQDSQYNCCGHRIYTLLYSQSEDLETEIFPRLLNFIEKKHYKAIRLSIEKECLKKIYNKSRLRWYLKKALQETKLHFIEKDTALEILVNHLSSWKYYKKWVGCDEYHALIKNEKIHYEQEENNKNNLISYLSFIFCN